MRCRNNFGRARSANTAQGSALVVVLWVVGLLAMFVLAFAFDMHVESRITSTWRRKLQAEYLARSGIELARATVLATTNQAILTTDPEIFLAAGSNEETQAAILNLARGGGAELQCTLEEGVIRATIRPENARINLLALLNANDRELTYETMTPLFESAGIPWEMRDELVDTLLDWVDQDELVRLSGAESQYYEGLTPPYKAKNRMLDTVDELTLIKGYTNLIPEQETSVYDAIAPFLTTYSDDAKININAVDAATLMAFLNIDEQMAEQIIAARAGPDGIEGTADDLPFKDLNDLLARVPILNENAAQHIAFSAMGRYHVRAEGQVKDVIYRIHCVLRLANNQIDILHWSEGNSIQNNEFTE